MRRTRAGFIILFATFIVMALLAVFALELSNNQRNSRHEITTQVHERTVLASTLVNGLYTTSIEGAIPSYRQSFGGASVSSESMDKFDATNGYLFAAVLGSGGSASPLTPLAGSTSYDAAAAAGAQASGALPLAAGHPFGQGNALVWHGQSVAVLDVPFPDDNGAIRQLLIGFKASTLQPFLTGTLRSIPGPAGSVNYVVDGNGVVIASSDPAVAVGSRLTQPGALAAIHAGRGEHSGIYFDTVRLEDSTWETVLASPAGALFASVSGVHQAIPWLVFGGFAAGAAIALLLGLRLVAGSERLHQAKLNLEAANSDLAKVNTDLAKANTDLAKANSDLASRAAELARSNEELDRFASIASHDLQEPLRKVRTFTEQLVTMENDRLSEKGRDYLRRANASAARMQQLIEDLLRFSRLSTADQVVSTVDLAEVARQVTDDLAAQVAEARAEVTVGRLPEIEADPVQMRQLVQNLLSNALKFRRPDTPPVIEFAGSVEQGVAEVRVRDNGIGFEPQYSDRIFRIFERLHGRTEYAGTGIGLALCRKIVERHGGSIRAEGHPGEGATFVVHLPVRYSGQHDGNHGDRHDPEPPERTALGSPSTLSIPKVSA